MVLFCPFRHYFMLMRVTSGLAFASADGDSEGLIDS